MDQHVPPRGGVPFLGEGVAPSSFEVVVELEGSTRETVWLACPRCQRRMSFGRTGGPQRAFHNPGGSRQGNKVRACRWAAHLSPIGTAHGLEPVPDAMRVEDLVDRRRREWEARFKVGEYLNGKLS